MNWPPSDARRSPRYTAAAQQWRGPHCPSARLLRRLPSTNPRHKPPTPYGGRTALAGWLAECTVKVHSASHTPVFTLTHACSNPAQSPVSCTPAAVTRNGSTVRNDGVSRANA